MNHSGQLMHELQQLLKCAQKSSTMQEPAHLGKKGLSWHRNFWSDSVKAVALPCRGKNLYIRDPDLYGVAFKTVLTFTFPEKACPTAWWPKALQEENRPAVQAPGEKWPLLNLHSLLPSLGSLAGFLPGCWCCLWCLNVIYGKIHWGYAIYRWIWHL